MIRVGKGGGGWPAKAFEDLEGVVEEIGEKYGKGSLWVKGKKEQLKSAKRNLKGGGGGWSLGSLSKDDFEPTHVKRK